LFEMAYRQAEDGNVTTLRMLLDRVWSVGRCRPLAAAMPKATTVNDTLAASGTVTNAVLIGEASAQEGEAMARLLTAHRHVVEHHDEVQVLAQMMERRVRERQQAQEEEQK
jgi:hypothetical protein